MKKLSRAFLICVVLATASTGLQAAAPKGWLIAGSKPAEYESGLDAAAVHNHHLSAYLKARSPDIDGFGTLMQAFRADHYLGKRVRFSASVKTAAAQWAGLWMRVDQGPNVVAFDNMHHQGHT